MYALRGQGCSIALLADADDATQWTTQAAFGLSEGIYMILTGPAGDTIANAVSTKQSVGLDTYACKLMFGDWIWWNDQVNAALRAGLAAGVRGRAARQSLARAVEPEQAALCRGGQPEIGRAGQRAEHAATPPPISRRCCRRGST